MQKQDKNQAIHQEILNDMDKKMKKIANQTESSDKYLESKIMEYVKLMADQSLSPFIHEMFVLVYNKIVKIRNLPLTQLCQMDLEDV